MKHLAQFIMRATYDIDLLGSPERSIVESPLHLMSDDCQGRDPLTELELFHIRILGLSVSSAKKTHSRTCSYTHKQVEKNVHRTDATPPTPSKFPMKCDGQTAVLTNTSMWECGFCAGPKLKPHCFKAK